MRDARWDLSSSFAYAGSEVNTFVAARLPLVAQHLAAFLAERMDPVEVDTMAAVGASSGDVALTWHTYQEHELVGWTVERQVNAGGPWVRVTSHQTHPELLGQGGPGTEADYRFDDQVPVGAAVAYRLTWLDTDDVVHAVPWIETVTWPVAPHATVLVNEFLASNDTGLQDETGAHEDWLELYNPGDTPVDLTDYHLSDDPAAPLKWQFPAGTAIPAGGFLLVWCDDDPGDGPLHATFKLSAGGESIGVYVPEGDTVVVVDEHAFGAQTTDVSEGRSPDGAEHWISFTAPTPGMPNIPGTGATTPAAGSAITASPNPFNPRCTITFALEQPGPVQLDIVDLAGRRVRTLISDTRSPGRHQVIWDGTDGRGASLPSGVYHALLRDATGPSTVKLSLVR